jgi:hypothetical protein
MRGKAAAHHQVEQLRRRQQPLAQLRLGQCPPSEVRAERLWASPTEGFLNTGYQPVIHKDS